MPMWFKYSLDAGERDDDYMAEDGSVTKYIAMFDYRGQDQPDDLEEMVQGGQAGWPDDEMAYESVLDYCALWCEAHGFDEFLILDEEEHAWSRYTHTGDSPKGDYRSWIEQLDLIEQTT